jgi:hypothetical protein
MISLRRRAVVTREKRSGHSDRRHGVDMPLVPFKDSNGATIKECRRKIHDRRRSDMAGRVY